MKGSKILGILQEISEAGKMKKFTHLIDNKGKDLVLLLEYLKRVSRRRTWKKVDTSQLYKTLYPNQSSKDNLQQERRIAHLMTVLTKEAQAFIITEQFLEERYWQKLIWNESLKSRLGDYNTIMKNAIWDYDQIEEHKLHEITSNFLDDIYYLFPQKNGVSSREYGQMLMTSRYHEGIRAACKRLRNDSELLLRHYTEEITLEKGFEEQLRHVILSLSSKIKQHYTVEVWLTTFTKSG